MSDELGRHTSHKDNDSFTCEHCDKKVVDGVSWGLDDDGPMCEDCWDDQLSRGEAAYDQAKEEGRA